MLLAVTLYVGFNTLASSLFVDSIKVDSTKVTKIEPQKQVSIKDSLIPASPAKQQLSYDTAGLDKITKKNGDVLIVKIINKNIYEVEYKIPGEVNSKKLNKNNIKEIKYANGKVEVLDNNPEKKQKDWAVVASENEWSKIKVVYNASDVTGMVEKGQIDSEFEAKKMNTEDETLERTAIVVLKKKAFALKASTILITEKTFDRQYGELPAIKMKATAYGNE